MPGRQSGVSGETPAFAGAGSAALGENGRSQSLHITAMRLRPWRGAGSKTAPREGRQEVGGAKSGMRQQAAPRVPETPVALSVASAPAVASRLRHEKAGSPQHYAESGSSSSGLPVHLRLLPTPPRGDAVTFNYGAHDRLRHGLAPR